MKSIRVGLLLLACAGAGCSYKADIRNLFASLTYGETVAAPPAKRDFQMFATVQLEAITAYADPAAAGDCFQAITPELLRDAGVELSRSPHGGDSVEVFAAAAVKNMAALPAGCAAIVAADFEVFAHAYARVASAIYGRVRDTETTPEGTRLLFADAVTALQRVGGLLKVSARPGTPKSVLALSGGSANGAFTAGFMFELLSARERALLEMPDANQRLAADQASKFEAVVGTSVGALISQVLDLYYVSPTATLSASQAAAISDCNAFVPEPLKVGSRASSCYDGAASAQFPGLETLKGTDRALQRCALTKLYRFFAYDNEQQLMCIENAPATAVVGLLAQRRPNLVRFDEMSRQVLDPVLSDFTNLMLANDVERMTVSVETEQNQTVGLDERACVALPSKPGGDGEVVGALGQEYCLSSGVMASVVLPFFARPVRHVYTGFSAAGDCGTWVDGGLRSGFPAYRALRMSRPDINRMGLDGKVSPALRVLAIDTGRLNGLPSFKSETVPQIALNAIGQMASQNGLLELAMAQQYADLRERELEAISRLHRGPGAARAAAVVVVPDAGGLPDIVSAPPREERLSRQLRPSTGQQLVGRQGSDWKVSAVFVPDDVPARIVAEAGYAFDSEVMRGLFTWGRVMAINRMLGRGPDGTPDPARYLPYQLGWPPVVAKRAVELASADEQNPTFLDWVSLYARQTECDPGPRIAAGKRRIVEEVRSCGALPEAADATGTPHYFGCPAGAK